MRTYSPSVAIFLPQRVATLTAIAALSWNVTGCMDRPVGTAEKSDPVWAQLAQNVTLSPAEQQDISIRGVYIPFMNVQSEKNLFAAKFSWMRVDQQIDSNVTSAWLEFLTAHGGEMAKNASEVTAEAVVEGRPPTNVRVHRLPVEADRFRLDGVPIPPRGTNADLRITVRFGEKTDSVVISYGDDR